MRMPAIHPCLLAFLLVVSPKGRPSPWGDHVHPVTLEIAELAGRIEGEQAARAVSIAFEDLLIGVKALYVDPELRLIRTVLRWFPAQSAIASHVISR